MSSSESLWAIDKEGNGGVSYEEAFSQHQSQFLFKILTAALGADVGFEVGLFVGPGVGCEI